jgi:hypothetical protein
MKKRILIILAIVIVGMQFFKLEPHSTPLPKAPLENVVSVPQEIQSILQKSCANCHSEKTVYPWYARIQPIGWWINHHIEEGRMEFNMEQFGNYPIKRQAHLLEEIEEVVESGEMPMRSYTLMHSKAKLSQTEKKWLVTWANYSRKKVSSTLENGI